MRFRRRALMIESGDQSTRFPLRLAHLSDPLLSDTSHLTIYTASKKSSHHQISKFDLCSNFFCFWEIEACYVNKPIFFTETTQNYLTDDVKTEHVTFFSAEESYDRVQNMKFGVSHILRAEAGHGRPHPFRKWGNFFPCPCHLVCQFIAISN